MKLDHFGQTRMTLKNEQYLHNVLHEQARDLELNTKHNDTTHNETTDEFDQLWASMYTSTDPRDRVHLGYVLVGGSW